MPRKLLTGGLTAALLLAVAPAQATKVQEYELDNGLQLFVQQDERAPVVNSMVWYGVGGSYELPGKTGIAHALEHMMFQGTDKYPDGEFSEIISANGGEENAFTGADYTAYYQKLEASRLPISFELEADRMRNLLLKEADFEKEIEVIKEERRMRTEDNPQSFTYETAMATAYQTSPYGQPIVGWMHDLHNLTVDDLRDWYDRWYAPNNARLVVVGDVEPDAVHELAQKHFADIPRAEVTPPAPRPEVEQRGMKRVKVQRPAQLPYLMMSYKVPVLKTTLLDDTAAGVAEWEPYALEVLVGILDGGDSARFSRDLVRESRVAASAGASYNMTARLPTSLLTLSGTPAQGHDVDELEQALREQVAKLKDKPVEAAELERIKTQVVASDVYQRDSVFYQGYLIGLLETVGLDWRMIDEYVGKVQAVTPEQVQEVAKKYLTDDRLTIAELEPLASESLMPALPAPTSEEDDHVH
ncbi:zinc protease [Methylohalomonas lacus]|uniref:Zinc protease n=1 Tax=Methylohalomonas lacus TaxID=398773 RepID=A0AAE3HJ32_9GAMM|nr:pitrilysin family protein [Methylohalomonas lacus]MCS3903304.1 zinc protease [Methylohalomonas lacus]